MATLVLQTAGAVIGSFVGGPIGSAIGSTIGTVIGTTIDQAVIGSLRGGGKTLQGSRLKDLDGISAAEGGPIPRLYGRARLGGQIIWATRFEEEAVYTKTKARGGKGGIGGSLGKGQKEVSYRYFANVAIGLCEGEIAFVRRIWADGKLLDLTTLTMRVHRGSELQEADPLIVAKQGVSGTPAYRGLAYIVFERFPLEAYGNRLPQMTFEVVRPVHGLCKRIRAINLIPGSGEHVYETSEISVRLAGNATVVPNRTQLTHATNWAASLDVLQALCPNLKHVSLVVSWFGNDLRAGQCIIRPLTEIGARDASGHPWSVAGLSRAQAGTVSSVDGGSAFGGTPSDQSVIRAIRNLKSRGLSVTLYPFVMMDIPSSNQLPNPWTGTTSQPAYPWRGRITCDPAVGLAGSVDSTVAAQTQVTQFMGNCVASQFLVSTNSVSYSGPAQDWNFSRFILHMAALAKAAGGVDSFILGSEFVALTRVRGVGAINPAVAGLKSLAGEARGILGIQTQVSYGADWTEYGAEIRSAGADVRFPLDPLWADQNIDAVALDWYPPITDWREGVTHADAVLYNGPHDQQMFSARIVSGEGFDWYYANDTDRLQQNRSSITDGAYNKPWIYRPKDILSWWSNPHVERINGVEKSTATAWVPQSKPIWLLELGCPAVDRGGNSPNVFPDVKSSENAVPHFSRGGRDDCVQSRHLIATIDHFVPSNGGAASVKNPVSTVYNGPMVDPDRIYLWAYDARPYPAFPDHAGIWADADAYETGHWLNGRLEGATVDDVAATILSDFGQLPTDGIAADGFLDGYVLDRPMSIRSAISPLSNLFAFDALIDRGNLVFSRRLSNPVATFSSHDFVVTDGHEHPAKVRAQGSELSTALTLAFNDPDSDFRQASVRVFIETSDSDREVAVEIPMALQRPVAVQRASVLLNESRVMRETITFALPPSRSQFQPGDNVIIDGQSYRLGKITDGLFRTLEAVAIAPSQYLGGLAITRRRRRSAPKLAGQPTALVLDLPFADSAAPALQYLAASVEPWPGSLTLWRSDDGSAYEAIQQIISPATIGLTTSVLAAGPLWLTDRHQSVGIKISVGSLESVSEIAMLQGKNLVAIGSPAMGWEIISFANAELLSAGEWRLSKLIRGLAGSEALASVTKPVGSQIVVLDGGINELANTSDYLNRKTLYRLSAEGRDHADAQAVQFEATAGASALMPLSPVHIRARRKADGIHLSWIRRTRFGGDSWEIAEVPLNEEFEAYQLEILNNADVKRSLTVSAPSALYSTAHEIADFGTTQANLKLRLCQISAVVGPGFVRKANILIV
jgi:GTA TIM-barrel-like domain/Putative phage tail protein